MMFCFIYRMLISHALDGDKPASQRTLRHISSCPACRRFYKSNLILQQQLRRDVPVSRPAFASYLNDRVMSEIDQQGLHTTETVRLGWAFGKVVQTAACAAALLIAMLAYHVYENGPQEYMPTGQHDPTIFSSAIDSNESVIVRLVQANPGLWHQLVDTPLVGECSRLAADADAARSFLMECLPVQLNSPEEDSRSE